MSKRLLKYFVDMRYSFLFVWNPNFPVGNKCGWLSSLQNMSIVRNSGLTFSPGAIVCFTCTTPVCIQGILIELNVQIIIDTFYFIFFFFSCSLSLTTPILSSVIKSTGSEMSEIGLLLISTFSRCFFYVCWVAVLGIITISKKNWDG